MVSIPREYTAIIEQWRRRKQSYQRASESTSSPSSHRTICTSRVAKSFPETGFNVVCDKPMTLDLGEALELKKSGKVFALTYNYTGYPMVKEAREIVRRGELGKISRSSPNTRTNSL